MDTQSCNIPRKFKNIQSFGCMLVLDRNTLAIMGMSENMTHELDMQKETIYSKNFIDLLKDEHKDLIREYLLYKVDRRSTRVILLTNNKQYYCHTYKSNDYVVIELEKKNDTIYLPFKEIHSLHESMRTSNFSKETIVDIVKNITNYKRVMLYEFTDDWDGVVTVENSEYTVKYLNIYFYESDIPRYVRGLFCKNPLRYIHDVEDDGVDIDWKDLQIQDKVDARNSEIINTHNSHRRYLRSIQARSSFSLAIMVNHKLWGLVLCHNDTPKYLSPFIRQQCFNFVEMFSASIANRNTFEEEHLNNYIYKLYQFISIFNFVSINEMQSIKDFTLEQIKKITKADDLISNLTTDTVSIIISSNLSKFNNSFYTNNAQLDFLKILNINIPPSVCRCIFIIKLYGDRWVGFIKRGKEKPIKWAGNNEITIEDSVTYPRTNFQFVEKSFFYVDKFTLSEKNVDYIKQLLLYLTDRINNKNYFSEYFLSHEPQTQQTMISNILHEIRNPLNAMVGLFDILNETKEYDQSIITDGIRITRNVVDLTSNMINISKFRHTDSLNLKHINWIELVNQCIDIYKYTIHNNEVTITYSIQDVPKVLSDENKLKQILSNLLSNSVKFTQNGNINIKVSKINRIDYTCWVQIEVKDTGCGIPVDKQIRLFKTFEQVNTDFVHSSGLGLTICSQIVTLLNGTITFESYENLGTTFRINLPMTVTKENVKILIVDDEPINRKILQFKLKEHELYIAKSGEEVIEYIKKGIKFQLILMDLQMPILDGFQTTEILRKQFNYTGKIVAVTGHSFEDSIYFKAGFDDRILKPIDFVKLNKIINTL